MFKFDKKSLKKLAVVSVSALALVAFSGAVSSSTTNASAMTLQEALAKTKKMDDKAALRVINTSKGSDVYHDYTILGESNPATHHQKSGKTAKKDSKPHKKATKEERLAKAKKTNAKKAKATINASLAKKSKKRIAKKLAAKKLAKKANKKSHAEKSEKKNENEKIEKQIKALNKKLAQLGKSIAKLNEEAK